ncbi:hypothetical protein QFZ99_001983 [Paraburkholderia atlantica]
MGRPPLLKVFMDEVHGLLLDYVQPLLLFVRWIRQHCK